MASDQAGDIRAGSRVYWPAIRVGGSVESIEGNRARVVLDNGDTHTVALGAGALRADPFAVGEQVERSDGSGGIGLIVAAGSSPQYADWVVAWSTGERTTLPESALRRPVLRDPIERMRANQLGEPRAFNLRSVAADLRARNTHDELVSLDHARVDLMAHQVAVVHRVVTDYPHRFLLCDEVGLGKTIEAGMIIKELRARRQADRVLVLTPAGLQRQWQYELKTKFNERFAIFNRATLDSLRAQNIHNPWREENSIIASHQFAARDEARRNEIAAVPWDLIVVDEAHHVRSTRSGRRIDRTLLYRLLDQLVAQPDFARRAVLFLTATPMQLQHHELYALVEMLRPTLFASEEDYEQHIRSLSGLHGLVEALDRQSSGVEPSADWIGTAARFLEREPERVRAEAMRDQTALAGELRSLHRLSEVMLRNRRATVGGFMPRRAFRWETGLSDLEAGVQEQMQEIIEEGYRQARDQRRNAIGFLMTVWQKLLASSSRALRFSLERRCERLLLGAVARDSLDEAEAEESLDDGLSGEDAIEGQIGLAVKDEVERLRDVIALLERIPIDSKARTLIEHLRLLFAEQSAGEGKVIVFTQFRDTQDMLAELIRAEGWSCQLFHGSLGPFEKDAAIERFRSGGGRQVLLSTEAGGEGRNLQFAHLMVNYDLPWNPMKVEQRIGRIDRTGQRHEVSVFNFHVRGTIESRILEVLENRVRLFEASVGGLEQILGEVEDDIRKALRLSAEAREDEISRIGEKYEREVRSAREAANQLHDLFLDASSYSPGIYTLLTDREPSATTDEFERFLVQSLKSVNTWLEEDRERPGVWTIHFHLPLTEEARDLIDGYQFERRSVSFDPGKEPDSENVEYFGFGHPIVELLVRRIVREQHDGAATVRWIAPQQLPGVRPGWQFNWLLTVSGPQPREYVHAVFVDERGESNPELGEALLRHSREFRDERSHQPDGVATLDQSTLEAAHERARTFIDDRRATLLREVQREANERYDRERERIERLYDNRARAASDRVLASESTLARLRASENSDDRRVVPAWEANVRRDQAELERVRQDRERDLEQLASTRNPQAEHQLLGVARIEVRAGR